MSVYMRRQIGELTHTNAIGKYITQNQACQGFFRDFLGYLPKPKQHAVGMKRRRIPGLCGFHLVPCKRNSRADLAKAMRQEFPK